MTYYHKIDGRTRIVSEQKALKAIKKRGFIYLKYAELGRIFFNENLDEFLTLESPNMDQISYTIQGFFSKNYHILYWVGDDLEDVKFYPKW